jgi:glycosyltransferase involved in cell wall biosynthesis
MTDRYAATGSALHRATRRRRGAIAIVCAGGFERQGGIGRLMQYVTDAWRRGPSPPPVCLIDSRGPHVGWTPLYLPRALLQILWLVSTRPVRLLHVNVSGGSSLVRKAAITALAGVLGVPVFLHFHPSPSFDGTFRRLPAPLKRIITAMFRRARCSIALGIEFRRYMVEILGTDPNRTVVLYNAAPPMAERPAAAHEKGLSDLLFLGDIAEMKGVPELLSALACEPLRGRNWHLHLGGRGKIDEYRHRADELGIAERVTFHGWLTRSQVADRLARAGMLLLPSYAEGLPIAVLEALGSKVPVITTPVGAMAELLVDGDSALIVPPGDVPALAQAILRLIDDTGLQRHLAEGGRRLFDERLSIDAYARSLSEIYDRLCPE